MRDAHLVCLSLLCLLLSVHAQKGIPQYSDTLHYSCFDSPFLGIEAYAPDHRSFPNVELELVDPSGRRAGSGQQELTIPHSHYGKIVEIPEYPARSKAIAVEICDAIGGRYIFSVLEHDKTQFKIAVKGYDGKDGEQIAILNNVSGGDRTCQYKFDFSVVKGKVAIRWLDRTNHPLPLLEEPTCGTVSRASTYAPGALLTSPSRLPLSISPPDNASLTRQ
jgi:hypothetical protein